MRGAHSYREGDDDDSASNEEWHAEDDALAVPVAQRHDTEGVSYLDGAAEFAATSVEAEVDSNRSWLVNSADPGSARSSSANVPISGTNAARYAGITNTEPVSGNGKGSVRWSDTIRDGTAGSGTANDLPEQQQQPPSHGYKSPRRTGLLRPHCRYGMDAVGEHVASIRSWIETVHRLSRANSGTVKGTGGGVGSGLSLQRLLPSSRRRRRRRPGESGQESRDDDEHEQLVRDDAFPIDVAVHPTLTDALDGLAECMEKAARRDDDDDDGRQHRSNSGDLDRIVEVVARIPSLVKTVLLIEDEAERSSVLASPVLRRVLLCPYSIVNVAAALDASIIDEDEIFSDDGSGRPRLYKESGDAYAARSKWSPIQGTDKSWLLEMLKTGEQRLTDVAVDYLEMISVLSLDDYLSVGRADVGGNTFGGMSMIATASHKGSKEDEKGFAAERDRLFETVARLRLVITYIFALPERDIERVAVTAVVRRALDDAVSSPFSMATLFLDLVFHILILLLTRFYTFAGIFFVEGDFDSLDVLDSFWAQVLRQWGVLALFYFVYRLIGQLIAMSRISWRVFWVNLIDFWQVLEISAIGMVCAVYAILWLESKNSSWSDDYFDAYQRFLVLSAFSIGLLWFNFVGFLKVLNWKLATFVLAIGNIITDIRLFILVLLFIILAFGDIFFTLVSIEETSCPANFLPSNSTRDEFAEGAVNTSPFCEGRGSSYFAVYKVLVGDVDASEYEASPITMFFFVVMTFCIVIVSLNILIALVDESYERSTMTSARLFGKARIALVAKNSALEHLLHPQDSCNLSLRFCGMARNFMRILSVSFVAVAGILFGNTTILVKNQLHDSAGWAESWSRAFVCAFSLPLFYILAIMLSYLFTGWKRRRQKRWKWLYWLQSNALVWNVCSVPIHFFMGTLLGTRKKQRGGGEEVWRGRLNHVESTVLRIVTESESRTRETIVALERRLEQSEATRKRDLAAFENRINQLETRAKADRKVEMEEMERRMVQAFVQALSTSTPPPPLRRRSEDT